MLRQLNFLNVAYICIIISCENRAVDKPTTTVYTKLLDDKDVEAIIPNISNWNRWGPNDHLGTVNLITPEKLVAASKLIEKGITISLARETSIATDDGVREGSYRMQKGMHGSRDYVGAVWHGFTLTHLDGLSHVFADTATLYNGYSVNTLTEQGSQEVGIQQLAEQGIAGRGVLIDMASFLGEKLTLGYAISPQELDLALNHQGVELQSGDIVFIRNGFGIENTRDARAGLHPSCLEWARHHDIAILGSDGDNDAAPMSFDRWSSPFHTVGIPYLGLPLIDNVELDLLSEICLKEARWEFFVVIAPWRLHGVSSSPINPIAIF
jgi:kynurenine formamidase